MERRPLIRCSAFEGFVCREIGFGRVPTVGGPWGASAAGSVRSCLQVTVLIGGTLLQGATPWGAKRKTRVRYRMRCPKPSISEPAEATPSSRWSFAPTRPLDPASINLWPVYLPVPYRGFWSVLSRQGPQRLAFPEYPVECANHCSRRQRILA